MAGARAEVTGRSRSLKGSLRRSLARTAPKNHAPGVRVLMYHSIDDPHPIDPLSLRVSPRQFVEQMTLLRSGDYLVVPLHAVSDAQEDHGRLRVAITFDDGYLSQKWAARILKEFGFSATFFLVPRFLDAVHPPRMYWEEWGALAWDDAAALLEDGFEIGAHSATHPDLRQCPDPQLETEVSGAKAILEQRLKTEIASFSYPSGRHDRRVRAAVAAAGYRLACTSQYGLNRISSPFDRVRRIEIAGSDTLRDFEWKLHGKYDWIGYWQALTAVR